MTCEVENAGSWIKFVKSGDMGVLVLPPCF